jgi:hypothetical protein
MLKEEAAMRRFSFQPATSQPQTYRTTICLITLLVIVACCAATAMAQYPPNGSTIPVIPLTGGGNDQHPPSPPPPGPPDQQSQWNMELLGFDDLQGRSSYQPLIIHQGRKEIMYVGHHAGSMPNPLTGTTESNGTSILDVTNPKKPKYLHHIPGPTSGDVTMVRVCSGSVLPKGTPGHWYMLRNFGSGAHQVWDVTNATHPSLVATIGNQTATHKNWWECDTGIAYLVGDSTDHPGWQTNQHVEIYDLSNPASPQYIRDFGLDGQQPSAPAPHPPGIHGPISAGVVKNRIYLAYGVGSDGVIQIVDRNKLLTNCVSPAPCASNPSKADLLLPQVAAINMSPDQGGHSSYPVFGVPLPRFQDFITKDEPTTRDLVLVASEATGNECLEAPHFAFLLDVTHETLPMFISTLRVPEFPGNFCRKGGRFGNHSVTETLFPAYYGKFFIGSWFNAGVRVFDIRDPYHPQPIAYFIPAPDQFTFQNCANLPTGQDCQTVVQTNNAEVDDRGLIYIVDRAGSGMHILELTGRALKIAENDGDFDDE